MTRKICAITLESETGTKPGLLLAVRTYSTEGRLQSSSLLEATYSPSHSDYSVYIDTATGLSQVSYSGPGDTPGLWKLVHQTMDWNSN